MGQEFWYSCLLDLKIHILPPMGEKSTEMGGGQIGAASADFKYQFSRIRDGTCFKKIPPTLLDKKCELKVCNLPD